MFLDQLQLYILVSHKSYLCLSVKSAVVNVIQKYTLRGKSNPLETWSNEDCAKKICEVMLEEDKQPDNDVNICSLLLIYTH